jgi:NodT family efflux transporter outer membrane factor (OMF) lipoprotein
VPSQRRRHNRPAARARAALGATLALLLAGCTVGPDYKAPEISVPNAFVDAVSAIKDAIASPSPPPPLKLAVRPIGTVDLTAWWKAFDDAELNALVERAVAGNFDLAIALSRLQEARTEEVVVMGLALPSGDISGAAGGGTGSDITRGRVPSILTSASDTAGLTQINQIVGFDAGWELDLFGKYRREIEAARYDTEAATAARSAVLVAVVSDVVRAYVDLRGLQTRLAILRQNIDTESHTFEVVRQRFDRGLTNELDVTLARRELASLQATEAPLRSQIAAAQYAIAVLLGRMPQELVGELAKPEAIPPLPASIAPGLPLNLLRRRPDIYEAERQLAAATARIGVATADLYPHLVLTGAVGAQGQGLGITPATSAFIWSAGPGAYWNVLDFGTLDALVQEADLRTQEQLAVYRKTVLNAVQEVDGAIADFAAQQDRLRDLNDALTASQRALDLAQQRYDRGLTDFLNVLDAERQQYELEDQYAAAEQSAADDFVALYRALGGGWENYQAVPPIRQPQPAIVAAFSRFLDGP